MRLRRKAGPSEVDAARNLLSGGIPMRLEDADAPTRAQAWATLAQARHARALVGWTAALVFATVGLVGATISLIIVTSKL